VTIAIPRSTGSAVPVYSFIKRIEDSIQSSKQVATVHFERAEFDKLIAKFRGMGRGPGYAAYVDGSVMVYSLAEMFARRVGGKHNKNVIFILFGDLGGGKSMTLMKLGISCAQWLAKIRGGMPHDYFTFKNVAIIDPEMLQEQLANLKQYNIYILDDAGPGYDARTFMSKSNRDLNYILQTCRTSNNIILVSAPHGAMLDVTIHRVAQYYGEISEIRHEEGLTFLKVFRLIRAFREGKIYYVYMTKGGVSIRRYYTSLPHPLVKVTYDKVRDAKAKEIQAKRQEREREEAEKKAGMGEKHRSSLQFVPTPEKLLELRQAVTDNPKIPLNELMGKAGCSQMTMGKVLKMAGIRNIGSKLKKEWEVDTVWGDVQ
jgi:hypothetical protein